MHPMHPIDTDKLTRVRFLAAETTSPRMEVVNGSRNLGGLILHPGLRGTQGKMSLLDAPPKKPSGQKAWGSAGEGRSGYLDHPWSYDGISVVHTVMSSLDPHGWQCVCPLHYRLAHLREVGVLPHTT